MRQPPSPLLDHSETAGLLEQTLKGMGHAEQQHVELRLAVMQARIRIAELKATLRAFPAGAK